MQRTKLSVLIPCFNNGQLLSEMLDCCIRQSFKDFEVIVVDDQSTDNGATAHILEQYSKKDTRIKVYIRNREPKGSVTCRNIALQHSVGEYIIHFDADDLISDICLEKRVLYMEDHPECDYASFPAMEFYDRNKMPKLSDAGNRWGVECYGKDLLESFLTAKYSFTTWNNIYRKDAIAGIEWDERVKIYTDFSFIVPCILSGLKHMFSETNEVDYFYRKGIQGNMCSSFLSQEKVDSTLYLFDKTLKRLKARADYDIRKRQFFKFMALQNHRLLTDGDKYKVKQFLAFLKEYYPSRYKIMYVIDNVSVALQKIRCNSLYNKIIYRVVKYTLCF